MWFSSMMTESRASGHLAISGAKQALNFRFRYCPDFEGALTRQMKVSHRSRRRITTLSGNDEEAGGGFSGRPTVDYVG